MDVCEDLLVLQLINNEAVFNQVRYDDENEHYKANAFVWHTIVLTQSLVPA